MSDTQLQRSRDVPSAPPAFPAAPSTRDVPCPFCRSTETELLSLFGSQLSTMQYYCRACHTPFEYVKQESPSQPEP